MSSEKHRVTWRSCNKTVPLLIALAGWRLCTAQPSMLSVQQVFCQEDNLERKRIQINEAPKPLPSRLTCAEEAVLINARFFAYNSRTKLCQTSFSSSFSNRLKGHWIMYKCTKQTVSISEDLLLQTGAQKLAEDIKDYFPKRDYKSSEQAKDGTTDSYHNNNAVGRPVKVLRQSAISKGRSTKIQTTDHVQTTDTKSEKTRNILHSSKKAISKSHNRKKKGQRNPSRIVPRLRGATLVVITTRGYIAYVNTDKRRLMFVGNLNWQGYIAVYYHTKTDCVTKVKAKLSTTLCLASGKEISKPRNPRVLRHLSDDANRVQVYMTAKHIVIKGGNKRRFVPVIRPLDLQIVPVKGYVYCSCQRRNAVIIVSTPYWENRTDIIKTTVRSLNYFEIHPLKSLLFLCGPYGLLMLDLRLPRKETKLVPWRCQHFKMSRHMMFAVTTRLSTTFLALVHMKDGRRHDIKLHKLPKEAGKFNIQVLPPGHIVQ